MNFNKEEIGQLLYLLKKANKDPIYELECIIGSNFKRDINTKTDFINVLKRLKGRFTRMTSNNVLLISFSNEDKQHASITKHISRVVLNGNGLISHYAKHNKLNNIIQNVVFETKTFDDFTTDKVLNQNYGIRFNLKKEEQLDPNSTHVTNLVKEWSSLEKHFRKKQTFTFYEDENDFKIDISIISSNHKTAKKAKTLQQSLVLEHKNLSYEIEIEYIGNKKMNEDNNEKVKEEKKDVISSKSKEGDDKKTKEEKAVDKFTNIIKTLLQAKQQTLFIVGMNDMRKVSDNFKKLIKNQTSTYLPNVCDLEHPNLLQLPILNYFSNDYEKNIRMDYAVTDKADGVRYLLFINSDGKCYFKGRESSNDEYKYTGTVMKDYASSIFDGELVDHTMDGKFIQNYYMFDAYVVKGNDITKNPFGMKKNPSHRYHHVAELEKYFDKSDNVLQDDTVPAIYMLKIFKKNFYYGNQSEDIKNKLSALDTTNPKIMEKIVGKYDTKIFEGVEKILKKCSVKYGGLLEDGHMFSYVLDGLIFQPVNLGVNQNFEGETVKKIGGRWPSAFKWKPSHELTIDFMVKFNKDSSTNKPKEFFYKNNKYIQGTLFCKLWKTQIHRNMMAYKLINDGDNFNKYDEDFPFSPIYPYNGELLKSTLYDNTSQIYILVDKNNQMRCSNRDIINDGATIECLYDAKRDEQFRWVPKNVRPNKTPNSFMAAMGAWRLINNPITTNMILGKETIDNTYYYYNNQKSNESKAMRHFNNFVKDEIVRRGLSKPKSKTKKGKKKDKETNSDGNDTNEDSDIEDLSLISYSDKTVLDLACGRFGDFFKYCRHGASKLVGMDISPDNIFDIEKGAAVRALKSISQNQNCRPLVSNTMMLLGDCSKNLSSNEAGLDDLNKYYIDVLYGRIKPKHGKLSRMSGVGVNGFDLVVCNFAVHYMMNDYDSLHSFLQNVKENLVHKGYFIGSCLDGEEILKALKDDSKIEGYYKSSSSSKKSKSKSSKSSKSNKLIWSIEKVDKSKKLFEDDFIGQRISVYMDTFYEPTEENLVHIDFLAEEALNYNLKLVDTKLFIDKQDNLFNDYKKEKSDYHKKIEENDAVKQWTSFQRWFIFQKID